METNRFYLNTVTVSMDTVLISMDKSPYVTTWHFLQMPLLDKLLCRTNSSEEKSMQADGKEPKKVLESFIAVCAQFRSFGPKLTCWNYSEESQRAVYFRQRTRGSTIRDMP